MLNWRKRSMVTDKNLNNEMTKEEKRSSLEAQFWNDKQEVDKNSKLYKKIEKVCKNIDFKDNK